MLPWLKQKKIGPANVNNLLQSSRGEEDERPAVRPLCLSNGGSPRLLQRPDCVLRRHLGDNDLLPHLRDAKEEAGGREAHVPQQREWERSVRLPGPDVGGGLFQGLRVLHSLPTRYEHTHAPHLDSTLMNDLLFMFWELILARIVSVCTQRSSGRGCGRKAANTNTSSKPGG